MVVQIVTENGQKKIKPLTADVGAGLPVGTWCSFENDVAPNANWIRAGTTFDASAYPVLASYLGTNVVPNRYDHNRPSDLNSFVPSGRTVIPFTAEYDAEVIVSSASSEARTVTVNGETVCFINASNVLEQITVSLKKGDIVTVTGPSSTNAYEVTGFYYTHPLFIKATSGLSENQQDSVINALNVSRSYSTEETLTGAKWIDGKPIYRRVIDFGTLPNNTTKNINSPINNLDFITRLYGITQNTELSQLSLPHASSAWVSLSFTGYTSPQCFTVQTNWNATIYTKTYIVVEYTKTTE